jgi:hypothetical protein
LPEKDDCSRTKGVWEDQAMNVFNDTRSTLEKHMPLLLGLLIGFLAGKALKRTFWSLFGMYWALRASGVHLF